MKKIKFSEELECLVDEKYEGKRFKTITVWAGDGYHSHNSAEQEVRRRVEDQARLHQTDAYELISVSTFDSKQEYDPKPCTATATAILYKSK